MSATTLGGVRTYPRMLWLTANAAAEGGQATGWHRG
jgi:hypothetical protein